HPLHHATDPTRNANPITLCAVTAGGAAGLPVSSPPMPIRISGPFGAAVLAALLSLASAAAGAGPVRVLVKLRPAAAAQAGSELDALASRTGVELLETRAIVDGIHLVRGRSSESALRTLKRLRHDPRVLYAELDQRRYAHASPDDPLFTSQWYLQDSE